MKRLAGLVFDLVVVRLANWVLGYKPKTDAEWHALHFYARKYVVLRDIAESLWVRWGPPLPGDTAPTPWAPFEPAAIHVELAEQAWQENFPKIDSIDRSQVNEIMRLWYELALIDAGYPLKRYDFPRDIAELIQRN